MKLVRRRIIILFFLAVFIFFAAQGGFAEIHMWVDQKGVKHFSDRAPRASEAVGEVKTVPTFEETRSSQEGGSDQTPSVESPENEADAQLDQHAKVELYVTKWCPYCTQARKFLQSHGISFKEYDIEKNKSAAQRKIKLDGDLAVPLAVINGKKVRGYSPAAYREALRKD